jgi:hypothetical protein
MSMADRIAVISERLEKFYRSTYSVPVVVPLERWDSDAPPDPTRLHRPFGFSPPYEVAGFVARRFAFCPELIAAQTSDLGDVGLHEYLDYIEYHSSLHLAHAGMDVYELEEVIDRVVADSAIGTLCLVNEVQMRCLDA